MNQTQAILNHLNKFGSITSFEAFEDYGATRLSAIIFNLRAKGYDIESIPQTKKNRFGHVVTYSKYVLKDYDYITFDERFGL